MLIRITSSGFVKTGSVTDGHAVEFRHWKEVVDEAENFLESATDSEEEEAVVELWLEDPMSFQTAFNEEEGVTPNVRRTTGSMIRNVDNFGRKQAVVRTTNWDQEVDNVRNHVASVLGNMGAKSWEKLSK